MSRTHESSKLATRPAARRARAAAFALVALACLAGIAAGAAARRSVGYPVRTMGTIATVTLVTADSASDAASARAAHARFAFVDSLMSNWTKTSEVARLNRVAAAAPAVVDSEVALVIEKALSVGAESEGAFDITVEPLVRLWGFLGGPRRVPAEEEIREVSKRVGASHLQFDPKSRTLRFDGEGVRIDLGGIAKGYAVDAATRVLGARGVTNALVDISGNMFALGAPAGATAWRIGLRDPRDRVPYFGRVPITNRAISTSGKYEQFVAANGKTYGHIMDPRTKRPAEGLIAVTVLTSTAMDADAWSTALFVLGLEDAKRVAKSHADFDAVLVEPGTDGLDTVWVEESLRDRFTLEPAARELFRVRYF